MWPNVQYDGMGGMHYLGVIMLRKLEGMAPAPYPIKNRVNDMINNIKIKGRHTDEFFSKVESAKNNFLPPSISKASFF